MKYLLIFSIIFVNHAGLSQQPDAFEKNLKLDVCSPFAHLWGVEHKRWEFKMELESALNDNKMWEHILPKSIRDNNKIIITRNELEHFLRVDGIKIKAETPGVAVPAHWESQFGKQIKNLTFDKPIHVLIVKKNKVEKATISSLLGLEYPTFSPWGESNLESRKNVPVVYKQKNLLDPWCPVLLVTSDFINHVNLDNASVARDTITFGDDDFSGVLYKTGIDLNGDGQFEVLMYNEVVRDKAQPGDESLGYNNSIVAMFFKNSWYRTSYWVDGQIGLEGF